MKIKRLKKNDLKEFFKFLKLNFKKKHIFYKSKYLFDWQYFFNKKYNFYILTMKNKIRSVQGYITYTIYDDEIKKDSIFLSVWASSHVSAGSKIFYNLMKKVKYKLIVGLASSDQSFAFQKLINFKCGFLDHFFLTSQKYSKKLILPPNFSNFKVNKDIINYENLTVEEEIYNLNIKVFKYQIPKKTPKYLLNRYFKHPVYKYLIYRIKNNLKTEAIFVFRICKYRNSSAIRIIDFIGPDSQFPNGKYLFNHLLKKYSAEYIDIYSYGIPKKFLLKSNLEDVNKYRKQKLIIPNYFEPFIKKNIKLAYAFNNLKKTRNKIRFFKGDSDLDRPSKI